MTNTDFQANANMIKELLLDSLEKEGLLNQPASKIKETYAIVVVKKGWLVRTFDKLFGFGTADTSNPHLVLVKVLS